MSEDRQVARAIDALRRGWPVAIGGRGFLAIETADDESLAAFGASDILISGPRAVTLKLANQIDGTPTRPVLIECSTWINVAGAIAIADPSRDLANPLKGPFRTKPDPALAASAAALRVARLAGLMPAFFAGSAVSAEVTLTAEQVGAYARSAAVRIASRAGLPTRAEEGAEIVAFRSEGDSAEQVALLIGSPNGQLPLVRIHSECLTGDALGSLKCDCGPQLNDALATIAASGWGILLYLRQEGRGIGLVNKLRAYALQDQGFDTVDANSRLGFEDDERNFSVAAAMLLKLGQHRVRLLTNNPRKVAALQAEGVEVIERVPLLAGHNPHNQAYLDTKRRRSGHQL